MDAVCKLEQKYLIFSPVSYIHYHFYCVCTFTGIIYSTDDLWVYGFVFVCKANNVSSRFRSSLSLDHLIMNLYLWE